MSSRAFAIALCVMLAAGAVALPVSADARPKGIHKGMRGDTVKRLQRDLSRAGFRTSADGVFGPATKATLMRWERSKNRRADGIATRRDRRSLRRSARYGTKLLRAGMRGRAVRALQHHLTRAGFPTGRDGVFGPLTKSALARWERSRGRTADGVATRGDQGALMRGRQRTPSRPSPSRPRARAWISKRGFAHISRRAPTRVRRLIRAGNRIAKHPYKYGGGHGRWRDSGYDCSGSVSYALHRAGLLKGSARPSGGFTKWGRRGRGGWVTIYAHSGHMFMTVAGLRFDTTDRERDGTRWHKDMRSTAGYAVRHPGGIG